MGIAELLSLTAFIVVPNAGGALTGARFSPSPNHPTIKKWYDGLSKAPWNPPPWVFPIVWTSLYTMMGVASYLVWWSSAPRLVPMALYTLQLLLNFAWSPVFFGMQNATLGMVIVSGMMISVPACTYSFYGVSTIAGSLLVPYVAWTALATSLNAWVVLKNSPDGEPSPEHAPIVGES